MKQVSRMPLSQPGGRLCPPHYYRVTPRFLDPPTALERPTL